METEKGGMAEFGRRLRAYREQLGLSQVELAAMLGTDNQMIYQYESGRRKPGRDRMLEIGRALHVPVADLMGLEEEPGPPLDVPPWAFELLRAVHQLDQKVDALLRATGVSAGPRPESASGNESEVQDVLRGDDPVGQTGCPTNKR